MAMIPCFHGAITAISNSNPSREGPLGDRQKDVAIIGKLKGRVYLPADTVSALGLASLSDFYVQYIRLSSDLGMTKSPQELNKPDYGNVFRFADLSSHPLILMIPPGVLLLR